MLCCRQKCLCAVKCSLMWLVMSPSRSPSLSKDDAGHTDGTDYTNEGHNYKSTNCYIIVMVESTGHVVGGRGRQEWWEGLVTGNIRARGRKKETFFSEGGTAFTFLILLHPGIFIYILPHFLQQIYPFWNWFKNRVEERTEVRLRHTIFLYVFV